MDFSKLWVISLDLDEKYAEWPYGAAKWTDLGGDVRTTVKAFTYFKTYEEVKDHIAAQGGEVLYDDVLGR